MRCYRPNVFVMNITDICNEENDTVVPTFS